MHRNPEIPNFTSTNFEEDRLVKELVGIGPFTFMPNYGNMGDILIAQSEYEFFDRHRLPYSIYGDPSPEKSLVYGGGGIFVKNWRGAYQKVLDVFKSRSFERILILPSSFYDCGDILETVDERFTIFCREKKSRDYLLSSGIKANVLMEHDMALFLRSEPVPPLEIPETHRERFEQIYRKVASLIPDLEQKNGYKIAWLPRTDSERKQDWDSLDYPGTLDLSICINSDSRDRISCEFYARLFLAGLAAADVVVSDRLHIAIGATLLDKEVFLLDNSYGKLSGVYEYSLRDHPRVHFLEDIGALKEDLDRTLESGKIPKNASQEPLKKIGEMLS